MTNDEFNEFCGSLKGTTHVVQWGNSDVWKVGGKLFAVAGWNGGEPAYTFKVTPLVFEVLGDEPGIRPAPYLASRGMKWLQWYDDGALSKAELKRHIELSYQMIFDALPKKKQAEILKG